LLKDTTMSSLVNPETVKSWIKSNCERYDVIIDGTKFDKYTLNFVDGSKRIMVAQF